MKTGGERMKEEKITALVESYLNGNISKVKQSVRKMSKADFIDFAEGCRAYGIKLYQLRMLVE